MADSKLLVPFIRRWEGGYVNDPVDKGGATNAGVTIATYREYRKKKGISVTTIDDLKHMTASEWHEIFKNLYWDRWQGDRIVSQSVANILVDWVWGSGVHGIKIPQRVLGVAQDGVVGAVTIAAVNAQDPRTFFYKIKTEREAFLRRIVERDPSQNRFLKGWLNRLNALRYEG